MSAATKVENVGTPTDRPSRSQTRRFSYEQVKRMLDIAISLGMLIVASPVILASILAVWLGSKSSPLYSQRRLGLGGKVITLYKIRTMYPGSERGTGPVWS